MRGKDLIAATLFGGGGGSGSGGGSSGGGGGGSAPSVSPKEVNFYDYDGTCVHAYTVAEAQALSALPDGPVHDGLVFQGWNWSLEGVKGLTRAMNIGAMYTTDDGTTRLYITLQEGRTSPMLGVGVNGTVTVDWGDGTEPDVLTGTSTSTAVWTPNHAYAAPGDYVIRLTVDGEMGFTGSNSSNTYASILRHVSTADTRNSVYRNALKRVEIGANTVVNRYSFSYCTGLRTVTMPNGQVYLGDDTFTYCRSLIAMIIPKNVTRTDSTVFRGATSLEMVSLAQNTSVGSCAFGDMAAMKNITIPDGASVNSQAFQNCATLSSLVVPSSVTSIGNYTFKDCSGMAYYDFTSHTAVPTLSSTNAFSGIPDDCIFLIPAALYDEWIAATNWATYSANIKAY